MLELEYWAADAPADWAELQPRISEIHRRLERKADAGTGWVDWPLRVPETLLREIESAAETIRRQCTALVVIGIGGSYLGAKACLELLRPSFRGEGGAGLPHVYFAGHHLSAGYYRALLERLEEEEVCLCVISKSGTTLEPSIAFELLRGDLRARYGAAEAARRIYAVTDREKGALRAEALREGYRTFEVPEDIGGRYSVLTPVGLLPLAAAGIDIRAMLDGAALACRDCGREQAAENACYRYALLRHQLQERGKVIEIFEVYEDRLRYLSEWLKQLFGESECKDGRGVIPMSLQLSTDLHSMGQFLQEGRQIFFETVLSVAELPEDIPLEESALAGPARSMHALNGIVEESVRRAHVQNGTPNIRLTLRDLSAASVGYLLYFFEKACAVSCYLTGVTPFDQPGVEAYKRNIRETLADPRA